MKSSPQKELGIITALINRLETQRLPRALAIKDKLDHGNILDDIDIAFLTEEFADMANLMVRLKPFPECQRLVGKITDLYQEIAAQAIHNQGVKS